MSAQSTPGRFRPATSLAILALGCTVIAVICAIAVFEAWRQRQAALTSADSSLLALSQAMAQQTETTFHSVELVLNATAAELERIGGPNHTRGADLHRELQSRIIGVPQISGMAVVDDTGQIVAGAVRSQPTRENLGQYDFFRRHRDFAGNTLYVSPPRPSLLDGLPIIPVSRRLSAPDGSFLGVVVAGIPTEYFHRLFERAQPPEDGAFALFRTDGVLLARTPPTETTVIGHSFPERPELQPGSPDIGTARGPSPVDGALRLIAFKRLSAYPLSVNVSRREDQVLSEWLSSMWRLGLAALAAMALVAAAAALLSRQSRREEAHATALEESQKRLQFSQFALDHAADMVFWIDSDGRILYANHAAAQRHEIAPQDLIGQSITEVDPRLTDRIWRRLLPRLKISRRTQFQSVHQTRSGLHYPAEVSVNYVDFRGADFVCAFARDISQRKAAEDALAEKTAKLEASNAELEQFAYVASHDLREPLRMVNSFVTMLARRYGDSLNDEAKEFIAFAQDGAVRMDRLILDLLEYSRVGRLDRPLSPMLLASAIDSALRSLQVAVAETSARIEVSAELPKVLASEEELSRLYLNLIGNALKYRHPDRNPEIRLGARVSEGRVVCWISDNGIGISPQYYDRVFRIFQRLHGRDRYDGTGIGLAICKKIVERHGGRIWIESKPDQGSTFWFTLIPVG